MRRCEPAFVGAAFGFRFGVLGLQRCGRTCALGWRGDARRDRNRPEIGAPVVKKK
jgi:hypothetical protein